MKYGKLTVLSITKKKHKSGHKKMADCICDCGNRKMVYLDNLRSGHTKSCGCHKIERATKHGFAYHPLYGVWEGLVQRCSNPKCYGFKHYGGRGIKLYPEWYFAANFIQWAIDNGYQEGLTIDRINVNGNYEPNNCRFIPFSEQAANTRRAIKYVVDGKTYSQRGYAKLIGIDIGTLRYRIKKGTTIT